MRKTLNEDDVLKEIDRWIGYLDEDMITRIKIGIKKLPSAQPSFSCDHEKDHIAEVSKMDCISRQAAIAVADYTDYPGLAIEDVKKVTDEVVKGLKQLPSAQSEPCEDTVSREKVFEYFVSLWECIGTIMDRDEWEDVCKTTANELPSAQPSFSQPHEKDAYYDGYDNGYNAGFEAGQRDALMKDLSSVQPEHNPDDERKIADLHKMVNYLLSQLEQRWIPVTERLPEVGAYVLISKKELGFRSNLPNVCTAHRSCDPRSGKEEWNDMLFGKLDDDDVLAWMPLPELYKGGDTE